MNNGERYVTMSLELHLFFARIMKEHSLFLMAGITPVDISFAKEAAYYKENFEKLLCHAVSLSNGIVGRKVLASGEIITEFTIRAEQQTQHYTGIHIDSGVTEAESRLSWGRNPCVSKELYHEATLLNQKAIKLLDGLISLKETILNNVLCCKMFTMNYPLLLEHIIREAKLYREYVCNLENDMNFNRQSMRQVEQFWNRIMMEHALFIRGLLDPTENELIKASDTFAGDYDRLLSRCREAHERTITNDTNAALEETIKFRDFKAAGTKGIADCEIRSVILPLLADHVLREANHYIRLLTD